MGEKYNMCVSISDNLKRKEKEFVENIYGKTESNIIKELKLSLLIYNKIIIKEEILNNLIEIYNKNNKNEIKMIFYILSYIWLVKNELHKLKEIIYKDDLTKTIISNLITLSGIIVMNIRN